MDEILRRQRNDKLIPQTFIQSQIKGMLAMFMSIKNTIHIPVTFYFVRQVFIVIQLLLPLSYPASSFLWTKTDPASKILKLVSFFLYFSGVWRSEASQLITFILLSIVSLIIIGSNFAFSSYYHNIGRIPTIGMYFLIICNDFFAPILLPWISPGISMNVYYLYKNGFNWIFLLEIALYVFYMLIFCIQYQLCYSPSIVYHPGSSIYWDNRYNLQILFVIIICSFFGCLSEMVNKLQFYILAEIIMILAGCFIFLSHPFISKHMNYFACGASFSSCIVGIIQIMRLFIFISSSTTFFILCSSFTLLILTFCYLYQRQTLSTLNKLTLLESEDTEEYFNHTFKYSSQFLVSIRIGFQCAHPYVLSFKPMLIAINKWSNKPSLIEQCLRLIAIYPSQSFELIHIAQIIKQNFPTGPYMKSIRKLTNIIITSRNQQLTKDLKMLIKDINELQCSINRDEVSFWIAIMNWHPNSIFGLSQEIIKQIDITDRRYKTAMYYYPNNCKLCKLYAYFLRIIRNQIKEAEKWELKASKIQNNVSFLEDETYECGLQTFPLLPRSLISEYNYIFQNYDQNIKSDRKIIVNDPVIPEIDESETDHSPNHSGDDNYEQFSSIKDMDQDIKDQLDNHLKTLFSLASNVKVPQIQYSIILITIAYFVVVVLFPSLCIIPIRNITSNSKCSWNLLYRVGSMTYYMTQFQFFLDLHRGKNLGFLLTSDEEFNLLKLTQSQREQNNAEIIKEFLKSAPAKFSESYQDLNIALEDAILNSKALSSASLFYIFEFNFSKPSSDTSRWTEYPYPLQVNASLFDSFNALSQSYYSAGSFISMEDQNGFSDFGLQEWYYIIEVNSYKTVEAILTIVKMVNQNTYETYEKQKVLLYVFISCCMVSFFIFVVFLFVFLNFMIRSWNIVVSGLHEIPKSNIQKCIARFSSADASHVVNVDERLYYRQFEKMTMGAKSFKIPTYKLVVSFTICLLCGILSCSCFFFIANRKSQYITEIGARYTQVAKSSGLLFFVTSFIIHNIGIKYNYNYPGETVMTVSGIRISPVNNVLVSSVRDIIDQQVTYLLFGSPNDTVLCGIYEADDSDIINFNSKEYPVNIPSFESYPHDMLYSFSPFLLIEFTRALFIKSANLATTFQLTKNSVEFVLFYHFMRDHWNSHIYLPLGSIMTKSLDSNIHQLNVLSLLCPLLFMCVGIFLLVYFIYIIIQIQAVIRFSLTQLSYIDPLVINKSSIILGLLSGNFKADYSVRPETPQISLANKKSDELVIQLTPTLLIKSILVDDLSKWGLKDISHDSLYSLFLQFSDPRINEYLVAAASKSGKALQLFFSQNPDLLSQDAEQKQEDENIQNDQDNETEKTNENKIIQESSFKAFKRIVMKCNCDLMLPGSMDPKKITVISFLPPVDNKVEGPLLILQDLSEREILNKQLSDLIQENNKLIGSLLPSRLTNAINLKKDSIIFHSDYIATISIRFCIRLNEQLDEIKMRQQVLLEMQQIAKETDDRIFFLYLLGLNTVFGCNIINEIESKKDVLNCALNFAKSIAQCPSFVDKKNDVQLKIAIVGEENTNSGMVPKERMMFEIYGPSPTTCSILLKNSQNVDFGNLKIIIRNEENKILGDCNFHKIDPIFGINCYALDVEI